MPARSPPAAPLGVLAGVAQVPSPRQKVELVADVPLFNLFTGKLPVTSVAKFTALNDGAPDALPCKTVVVVPLLLNTGVLAALVIRPLASTVIVGRFAALPYEPAETPDAARAGLGYVPVKSPPALPPGTLDGVAQVLSPLKNVVDDAEPVALWSAITTLPVRFNFE